MKDLHFAIRSLSKSPGFSLAAILTLAIAIGANTAMFSILYAVVLQPLAIREPDRVVRVWETDPHNNSLREGASAPDFADWTKQQRVFSALAGTTRRDANLTDPKSEAERVWTTGVSYDFFTMLGVAPLAGRNFVAADDKPGAEPVAILSDALWRQRFGREKVVGRRITLDGLSYEVIGVMPQTATVSRARTDLWIPLTIAVAPFGDVRGVHNVYVVGRLKNGVTFQQAESEMRVIAARLEQQYPDDNRGRSAKLELALDSLVSDARPRLYILSAAVVAVLLIACINVAGLMLARADKRRRELAIRASLGASRGRIVRQLLTESLLLASIGGALGLLFAWWATRTVIALAPEIPRADQIAMSMPVLLFALGASFLSVVLFGIVPAIRTSAVQPAIALGSARGVMGGARSAGRGVLVVVEVALAVVLVIGAGVLLKSFANLMAVDVGVRSENVVAFSMKLPEAKYPVPSRDKYPHWPEATNFYDAALEQLASLPGIRGSGIGMNHPFESGFTSQISIVGQPETGAQPDEVRIRPVTPGYFETLGVALLRGRTQTRQDRGNAPAVIVINEALAKRYFANEDPLGRQIDLWGTPRTIIGVVKGERFGGPQSEIEPALYPPLTQLPMSEITIVVRATGDPSSVISGVRGTIHALDADIALYDVELLETTLNRTVATPRFQAVLITSFGAIALLLAAIGLYALIAYQVQQRTNEIGIRIALGATRAEVAKLVLSRAAALALTGIALGLGGALLTARFLEALCFQVSAKDPAVYVSVPLLLVAIALVATWVPARRAMKLDPATALHCE